MKRLGFILKRLNGIKLTGNVNPQMQGTINIRLVREFVELEFKIFCTCRCYGETVRNFKFLSVVYRDIPLVHNFSIG